MPIRHQGDPTTIISLHHLSKNSTNEVKKNHSVDDGLSVKIKGRLRRPDQDSDINVIQKFVFLIESDDIKDSINSFEPPELQLNTFSGAISVMTVQQFPNQKQRDSRDSVCGNWLNGWTHSACCPCR